LLLGRLGVRTLLVDQSDKTSFKIGETFPGRGQLLLASLQLSDVLTKETGVACTGHSSAWGSDRLDHRPSILDSYGPSIHLDRSVFDQALLNSASSAGVKAIAGRFVGSQSTARRHIVSVISGGQRTDFACSCVIDCTGRRSAFAASLRVKRITFDRQVAVVAVYRREASDTDQSILLETSREGWWYTAPIPRGRRVVMYFTDGDLLRHVQIRSMSGFMTHVCRTRFISSCALKLPLLPVPKVVVAAASRLEYPAGENWVAVGDAAATHDPLASVGIMTAMDGARAAVQAISNGKPELDAYCAAVLRNHDAMLATRTLYYKMEHRWPDSAYWLRRQKRVWIDG
jgi:flavin-dependent dehydrogenase